MPVGAADPGVRLEAVPVYSMEVGCAVVPGAGALAAKAIG